MAFFRAAIKRELARSSPGSYGKLKSRNRTLWDEYFSVVVDRYIVMSAGWFVSDSTESSEGIGGMGGTERF